MCFDESIARICTLVIPKERPEQVYSLLDLHQIERNRVLLLTKQ